MESEDTSDFPTQDDYIIAETDTSHSDTGSRGDEKFGEGSDIGEVEENSSGEVTTDDVGGAGDVGAAAANAARRRTPRRGRVDSSCFLQDIKLLPQNTQVKLPTKSGVLMKKSANKLIGWQKRWLRLECKRLMYFRKEDDEHPSGVIDFDLLKIDLQCLWGAQRSDTAAVVNIVTASPTFAALAGCCCGREGRAPAGGFAAFTGTVSDDTEVSFVLKPYGSSRVFEFKGAFADVDLWVKIINQHLAAATQIPDPLIVATQKRFWAIDRIPLYKFEEVANTADVILFKTKQVFSRVQRAFTRAYYDHVALIIRKGDGTLYMLEALGNCGVCLTEWSTFVKNGWMSQYKRIALRRVFCDRTQERLDSLLAFCFENVGKPYGLTFGKLMRSESLDDGSPDFFCSELVAQALKAMSILKKDGVASTQVWPGSFAQSATDPLPLADDCSMSRELMIDFSLP